MKSIIYSLALFITAGLLFSGCEEIEEGLLNNLAEGKMVVVFDNGAEELLDCTFGHYGEGDGLTGEVFIEGMQASATTTGQYFSIMYGSWSNDVAFTTKTYSTAKEEDMIGVHSTYGQVGEDASVTIVIASITESAIKGTFTGKLSTADGLKNINGAFWAVKEPEHTH